MSPTQLLQDADSDIRLMRRIVRDTQERGRTVEEVLDQYHATVRPMHDEWVVRSSRHMAAKHSPSINHENTHTHPLLSLHDTHKTHRNHPRKWRILLYILLVTHSTWSLTF